MQATLRTWTAAIGIAASAHLAAQPLPPLRDTPYPGVIALDVDATDLDHKVFRVKQTLPVQPGPLVLYYPRWLPGDHAPTGRVSQLSGLQISAHGKPLAWKRNPLDTHAFHLDVPEGVSTLEIEFQCVTALRDGPAQVVVSPDMLDLQWNSVLLYPAGYPAARVRVRPRLTLPVGWKHATALAGAEQQDASVSFQPVSAQTLVDSPVVAGRYFQQIDLDPGAQEAGRPPVFLNVVVDQPRQGVISAELLAGHRALVAQADRVFGPRRYARYDMLLAVTDELSGNGLEHLQSSEVIVKANYFSEWAKGNSVHHLAAHEYAHSWNGKYRRPADLLTPDFNTPMQNSLLWMYEGQTEYWGTVLAARAGLMNAIEARDELAETAAWLSARAGRVWRNLQDTTNEPILSVQGWARDWRDWQRGADYYDESRLIWLEADMLIRERSNGKRSLDDFARAFFNGPAPRPADEAHALPYGFDDIVRELNRVQAYDWASFLRQRLDGHDAAAPLSGITQAGWQLAWSEQPSEFSKAIEGDLEMSDFSYSLGMQVGKEDKISRVTWGSPAFQAGITPGATLLAVNGRSYKADGLKDAITDAKTSGTIDVLVKTGERYRTVPILWRGGLRYPRLERIDGTPDRLSQLLSPLK